MEHIINIKPRKAFNKKFKGFINSILKYKKKTRKKNKGKNGKTKKQNKGGRQKNKIIVNVAISKENDPYITVDGVHYPAVINMWDDWFGSVEDFMGILMDSEDVKRDPKFVQNIEISYDKRKGKPDVQLTEYEEEDSDTSDDDEDDEDDQDDQDDENNEN